MQDVLIIGAGVAGLTVARDLSKAGWDILMLEKSRGVSGRSATRTLNGHRVDHGAQYFTVRDEGFQRQVDEWLHQGHLKIWSHGFHRLTPQGLEPPTPSYPRYVFLNGMNTVGKLLGKGLKIQTETKVARVEPAGKTWRVSSETGESFEAKTVILNMPPEQALALCPFDLGKTKPQLERVVLEPCFTLMLGYDKTLAPDWQGVLVETSDVISWLSHDSSKRTSTDETVIVIHSTPQFARKHFDDPPETVKAKLLATLSTLNLEPFTFHAAWSDLQRWKYALASTYLDVKFLQCGSLYFCGDWCGGARLEAAYVSGLALAQHLTNTP